MAVNPEQRFYIRFRWYFPESTAVDGTTQIHYAPNAVAALAEATDNCVVPPGAELTSVSIYSQKVVDRLLDRR